MSPFQAVTPKLHVDEVHTPPLSSHTLIPHHNFFPTCHRKYQEIVVKISELAHRIIEWLRSLFNSASESIKSSIQPHVVAPNPPAGTDTFPFGSGIASVLSVPNDYKDMIHLLQQQQASTPGLLMSSPEQLAMQACTKLKPSKGSLTPSEECMATGAIVSLLQPDSILTGLVAPLISGMTIRRGLEQGTSWDSAKSITEITALSLASHFLSSLDHPFTSACTKALLLGSMTLGLCGKTSLIESVVKLYQVNTVASPVDMVKMQNIMFPLAAIKDSKDGALQSYPHDGYPYAYPPCPKDYPHAAYIHLMGGVAKQSELQSLALHAAQDDPVLKYGLQLDEAKKNAYALKIIGAASAGSLSFTAVQLFTSNPIIQISSALLMAGAKLYTPEAMATKEQWLLDHGNTALTKIGGRVNFSQTMMMQAVAKIAGTFMGSLANCFEEKPYDSSLLSPTGQFVSWSVMLVSVSINPVKNGLQQWQELTNKQHLLDKKKPLILDSDFLGEQAQLTGEKVNVVVQAALSVGIRTGTYYVVENIVTQYTGMPAAGQVLGTTMSFVVGGLADSAWSGVCKTAKTAQSWWKSDATWSSLIPSFSKPLTSHIIEVL